MKKPSGLIVLILALTAALASAEERLSGPVLFHLNQAERFIERAEQTVEKWPASEARRVRALQSARADMAAANAKMAEFEQLHGDEVSPFHSDLAGIRKRIQDVETRIHELTPRTAVAEPPPPTAPAVSPFLTPSVGGTAFWRSRMRPFVTAPGQPGYDPDFYLEPHATTDPVKMQRRLDIYARAAATLTEYRQAHFGGMAPVELQQLALDIDKALRRFGLSCIQHADENLAEADALVRRLEEFVQEQIGRLAREQPFQLLDRDQLRQIELTVSRAARLVRSDDACLADLRDRLIVLKRQDARLRSARAADTRMRPDAYAGGDAVALQQVAARIAQTYRPGIRIHRVVLASPVWREESLIEWSDFDQVNLQQRAVRKLTAQVAASYQTEVRLYTISLRQDQLPSGIWGPVAGSVMFDDPMLAEHIR